MTIPMRFYRYGIAAEKELFDGVKGCADGFVLPAQLVVDQKASLSPWLKGKKFFIDPMTHPYFSDQCEIGNSDGSEFKRSYDKLREEYGSPYSDLAAPNDKLDASTILASFDTFSESLDRVVSFQETFVQKRIDEDLQEYFRILSQHGLMPSGSGSEYENTETKPDRLLLPYVYFENTQTQEYELNRRIWNWGKDYGSRFSRPLCAVIATGKRGADWPVVVDHLKGKVACVVLWFSEIDELTSPIEDLIGMRRACQSLSKEGLRVHIHCGGAFAMGLGFDGVNSVASGATYGGRRALSLVEGGPVPQRYFFPQLLRVLALADARFAYEILGLECNNDCCRDAGSSVDSFVATFFPGDVETSWGPTRNTKLHYLRRFKQKMNEIWKDGKEAGIVRLMAMKEKAEASLPEDYWAHFDAWIQAYEKKI